MLFWSKCLLILYQSSIILLEPLLPLYLYFNGFKIIECTFVFISTSFLTMFITGFWTKWIDQRSTEERYLTAIIPLFSLMGLLSFVTLLNQPSWIMIYSILNGLFYQPLQILVDGLLIKILGDLKVLFYGSFISQSKMIGIIAMLFQSCFYYYFNNSSLFSLLVPSMISTILLLLISLFGIIKFETLNSNISQDQALLKSNHQPRNSVTAEQQQQIAFYYYHHYHYPATYKPYSLFANPLSHISERVEEEEEEELLLDEESLRVYTLDENLFHATTRSSYVSTFRTTTIKSTFHSLCLFVFNQQHKDGLSGLWISQEDVEEEELPIYKRSDYQQQGKMMTLMLTVLCMGMARGWIVLFLPLYHFYVLELSISSITCLLLAYNLSEWITTTMVEKYFQRLSLILITTCVHLYFIIYVLIYPYIKPLPILLFTLQFILGGSFQWIWLSSSKTVNMIVDSYYERMKLRSIMSCLYTCIGPSIGALVVAVSMESVQDFAFLINQALFLFVVSFLISWGWSF